MDLINFKRQLSLHLYDGPSPTWSPNFPWWFNISPVRSRVLRLKKLGAVLTGSRALQGYRWEDKKVMSRKPNDWDWILTRSQLLEFFKQEKIYDLDLDSKVYRVNNSLVTFYDSYSNNPDDDTPIFNGRLDLIIVDELEDYEEFDGWKVQKFAKIWEHKCQLDESVKSSKHFNDINYLNLNFLI